MSNRFVMNEKRLLNNWLKFISSLETPQHAEL